MRLANSGTRQRSCSAASAFVLNKCARHHPKPWRQGAGPGGRYQIMEGPETFKRFVVIEFPSLQAGIDCFESPEYKAAAAFRSAGAGVVENVIVEGGDATVI